MTELVLTKTGVGMESGTVVEWRVRDGDQVDEGLVVGILETDKVEVELAAPNSGVIRLRAEEGVEYPVGTLLASIEPTKGAR